jgi:hypothetical protein
MAGCIPADVPAFEHRDAGAEARGLQRHRQSGKPGADHADVDVQVERKPRAPRHVSGIMSVAGTCGSLAHVVFLRARQALVTLSRA